MYRTKKHSFGQIIFSLMVISILISLCGCTQGNNGQKSNQYKIVYSTANGIFRIDSDGSNKVKIADEGEGIVVSPDGTRILYKSGELLYCVNTDGSGETNVGKTDAWSRRREYEFSPDGSRVLYEVDATVYLVNPDGTGVFLLTAGSHPTFSPDGTRVFYTEYTRKQSEWGETFNYLGISSVRLDGTDKRALVDPDLLTHSDIEPFYSPDKSQFLLAYGVDEVHTSDYARIISATGQMSGEINRGINSYDTVVRFSPDGSCLCISDNWDNRLIFVDSDGMNDLNFYLSIEKSSKIKDPVFSPDSKSVVFCAWTEWNRGNDDQVSITGNSFARSIVFTSVHGGGEQNIYVNPVDRYDPICLTNNVYARSPLYSPDGSKIIYIAVERLWKTEDDYTEDDYEEFIYIMNADGSDPQRITGSEKIKEVCFLPSNE